MFRNMQNSEIIRRMTEEFDEVWYPSFSSHDQKKTAYRYSF